MLGYRKTSEGERAIDQPVAIAKALASFSRDGFTMGTGPR